MHSIRLYFKYTGLSIKSQLQYRASFIMMTLGHCIVTIIDFLAIWVLFSRFGSLQGWTMWEIALFYGAVNVSFAIAEALSRGFDMLSLQVISGEFDRSLLRPRTTFLQVLGHDFQLLRIGRLMQGALMLVWASINLGIHWTIAKSILLFFSVFGGIMLFTGLMVLQATMCFWSTQTLEIMSSFTYGGVYTAEWPLSIYEKWFSRIFIFIIPLACVSYFPILAILGKSDAFHSPAWFQWVSPAAGVIFLVISLIFWRFGVRHYCSTGS